MHGTNIQMKAVYNDCRELRFSVSVRCFQLIFQFILKCRGVCILTTDVFLFVCLPKLEYKGWEVLKQNQREQSLTEYRNNSKLKFWKRNDPFFLFTYTIQNKLYIYICMILNN